MSDPAIPDCWICGKAAIWARYEVPQGALCIGCGRRRHYHPAPCPVCQVRRPLAFLDDELIVCAGCAGVESPFACQECRSEEHLYGRHRCARCFLRERLTDLLSDPATGEINVKLQRCSTLWSTPNARRPRSGGCVRSPASVPRCSARWPVARCRSTTPPFGPGRRTQPHGYLRHLLAAVGVLDPYDPYIERMGPWLDGYVDTLPEHHRELLRRFGRWHVMKQMRQSASAGRLTRGTADAARHRVRTAARVLVYFDERGVTASTATQVDLDHYVARRGRLSGEHGFIRWLRTTGVNTAIRLPTLAQRPDPAVNVGEDHRWEMIDRLLHDDAIKRYARIGGLFTLLFAQRMIDIVAMKTSQISYIDEGLHVAFNNVAVAMPAPLDTLIAEHLTERGMSLHASRDTGWLFPGGSPGRHIATENIRRQLVEIGMKPYEGRKAALFQRLPTSPHPSWPTSSASATRTPPTGHDSQHATGAATSPSVHGDRLRMGSRTRPPVQGPGRLRSLLAARSAR